MTPSHFHSRIAYLKGATTLLLVLCWLIAPNAQGLEHHAIATQGNAVSTQRATLSWTIGQPFIKTAFGERSLTQGFQQPDILIQQITEDKVPPDDISVYPNPSSGIVHICIPNAQEIHHIQFYDTQGALLLSDKIVDGNGRFNINHFPSGTYFLTISTKDSNELSQFKIIKL